jgi:hypothetical protein
MISLVSEIVGSGAEDAASKCTEKINQIADFITRLCKDWDGKF